MPLRIVRPRMLALLAALPLLGLLVALVAGLAQPAVYRATAQVYVSTTAASDVNDLSEGASMVARARDSYADVTTTPLVLQRVIGRLHLTVSPTQLAERVRVDAPADTALLDVSVAEPSARAAAREANAVAEALTSAAASLRPTASPNAVRLAVVHAAAVPGAPDRTALLHDLLIGGLAGLAASLLVLAILAIRRPPAGGAGLAAPSML